MAGLRLFDDDAPRPDGAPVGRLAAYALRVSLLEACNYRCPYCLPGAVTKPSPGEKRLTPAEYARLAPLFAAVGTQRVRFTGGEPLLRKDVVDVVAAFRAAAPTLDLALTTNGALLPEKARALADAGLARVTVHVDTLRPERYASLMGDGDLRAVLDGVLASRALFRGVKLNVVVQRGANDDELHDFLAFSRAHDVEVRFIELMNTGSAREYTRRVFVPGREIVQRLDARPVPRRRPSDPAALYEAPSGVVFGVIASDTEPFCGTCDRLRLTADGRLRGCLYQPGGAPLGALLKAGATDAQLAALLDSGLDDKRSWHPLAQPARPAFSMADVGG